jgi:mannose-6-phosphate isomerase-like protein (cupin superfamily)
MQDKTEYDKIRPYTTKDGSIIRELFHPDTHGNRNQSLAEAVIPIDYKTIAHKHLESEEIYHITEGTGLMICGDKIYNVKAGDTLCIPPGTAHQITNTGSTVLKLLCCCSPPYSHDDTELLKRP